MTRAGHRPDPFTERTPRVAAARRLVRRVGRERAGRFLAEGVQAVDEAMAWAEAGRGRVHELFVTESAAARNEDLLGRAAGLRIRVSVITDRAAAGLSETVTPQGIVAVCDLVDAPLDAALAARPALVAVLVNVADPGNAGTVIRVADAAGAGAVLLAGDTVDPHNGKCVRATTGSLFHLPLARSRDVSAVLDACVAAGLRLVAADPHAGTDLDTALRTGGLDGPVAWVFGSEAHGIDPSVAATLPAAVRVPIYGGAESLNLATAAAVCLYTTARAQRASAP